MVFVSILGDDFVPYWKSLDAVASLLRTSDVDWDHRRVPDAKPRWWQVYRKGDSETVARSQHYGWDRV